MTDKEKGALPLRSLAIAAGVLFLAIAVSNIQVGSITGPPAPKKPFRTFESFFPFYLTEHSDMTNRRLHLVGTTFVLAICAYQPMVALSILTAGSVGYVLTGLFAGLENGFLEFAILMGVFLGSAHHYMGRVKVAIMVPLIAYAFAWFGHFYFEKNKPASFIYPTFSLMGDFVMFFKVVTGAEKGIWM